MDSVNSTQGAGGSVKPDDKLFYHIRKPLQNLNSKHKEPGHITARHLVWHSYSSINLLYWIDIFFNQSWKDERQSWSQLSYFNIVPVSFMVVSFIAPTPNIIQRYEKGKVTKWHKVYIKARNSPSAPPSSHSELFWSLMASFLISGAIGRFSGKESMENYDDIMKARTTLYHKQE